MSTPGYCLRAFGVVDGISRVTLLLRTALLRSYVTCFPVYAAYFRVFHTYIRIFAANLAI